ncbi:hypothetical protein VNO77_35999 [Canavalia gladiata]|uniref:Uncharacterized protein n=1 Tax=Canavalia gladiata TaxID=3824 RepID=A0AAN9K6N2_CANGL
MMRKGGNCGVEVYFSPTPDAPSFHEEQRYRWAQTLDCQDFPMWLVFAFVERITEGGFGVELQVQSEKSEKIGRERERENQRPLSLTCLTNSHLEAIRVFSLSLSLSLGSVPSPLESKAYKTTPQAFLELLLQHKKRQQKHKGLVSNSKPILK